ncbi:MAG: hypothetical protein PHE43_02650 [Candidatus Nanoarchaeia archaeon]|nr:hypothetical protein [Candidatus Nanoarchaeia archaeon]
MKKVIFIFIVLVLMNLVYAGEIKTVNLTENKEQIVVLSARDAVKFGLEFRDYEKPFINEEGKEQINFARLKHSEVIKIDDVNSNGVDLAIFIEGAETPQYVTLEKGKEINLDIERDFIDDMTIKIVSILNDQVSLQLVMLPEDGNPDLRIIAKEKNWYPKEEKPATDNYNWYTDWKIIVGVVLIILILLFNRRRIKRMFRRLRRRIET